VKGARKGAQKLPLTCNEPSANLWEKKFECGEGDQGEKSDAVTRTKPKGGVWGGKLGPAQQLRYFRRPCIHELGSRLREENRETCGKNWGGGGGGRLLGTCNLTIGKRD